VTAETVLQEWVTELRGCAALRDLIMDRGRDVRRKGREMGATSRPFCLAWQPAEIEKDSHNNEVNSTRETGSDCKTGVPQVDEMLQSSPSLREGKSKERRKGTETKRKNAGKGISLKEVLPLKMMTRMDPTSRAG